MPMTLQRLAMLFVLATAVAPALGEEVVSPRIKEIADQRCGSCHGPTGQGENAKFPKLSGQNAEYLAQQMFNFKTGARKSIIMGPQLADLTGEDAMQLARHFSAQRLVPNRTTDPALVETGRPLFLQGNPGRGVSACASCHGPTARGAQMLPRLAGQHAEYLEAQLRGYIQRSRTTDQTQMHSVAANLGDDEIRAVTYFLSGLE